MKRFLVMIIVAAGLAAIAIVASRASSPVSDAHAATTSDITFTEGVCGQSGGHCRNHFVNGDPTGFGARIIFSLPISSSGSNIGREKGECVFLNKRSSQYFCTYNIRLAGGQVSVQGALPYVQNATASIPVTGGTGSYEGAYGHLTLLKIASGPVRYQLHIVTP